MALRKYSLTNLGNSVSTHLATTLVGEGYLIYWKPTDTLQVGTSAYPNYFAQQETILRDPGVAAALSSARGIVSFLNQDFSFPEFPVRPTSDGTVAAPEDAPVPLLSVQVEHGANGDYRELGSRVRWRHADLTILGYARTFEEQLYLVNALRTAFDEGLFLTIRDHDAGTRAVVDDVEIVEAEVQSDTFPLKPDALVYEVSLSARLRYEA